MSSNPEDQAISRLDAFGQSLATKRKEAVEFRDLSGLEMLWEEDQEFYDGIDNANRAESYEKPATTAGRLTTARTSTDTKSTIFVNITQPYVDMATSRLADMLLPTDDKPFGLKATPVPELEEYKDSDEVQTFPDGSTAPAKDVVRLIKQKADEIAERSERRIWDWLVESQWHAEVRKIIEDAGRIGTGVLKGPFPYKRKTKKVVKEDGENRVVLSSDTQPRSKRIDVRNLFPDPACGESIHNGSFIFERDYLTKKQLQGLKGGDYLDDQIDKCLKEGPGGSTDPKDKSSEEKKKKYEIWYFNGQAEKEDLAAAGCECDDNSVPVQVIMVNDRVIKAAVSPLDSGEFPYDVLPWQRKGGSWAGIGVARQVRTPQRMINGATRVMMDNAGLSAGVIMFLRRNGIAPADGRWELTRNKLFFIEDADVRRVEDALKIVSIPSAQVELYNIVKYALDLAERLTNMPLMMQGQQGDATETVGGMQLLQNNSSSVLRKGAKIFDDYITEPHVRRYYEWLLLYGEDPEEKGDCQIDARGSSALFERDAQHQAILQMAAVVKDPAFGIDPKKWIVETFKAQKLDPARFQYTEDETEALEKQKTENPPVDPRIAGQAEVAKIRIEGDLKKTQDKLTAEAAEAEKQRQHDIQMKRMDWEIKLMEYSEKRNMSLDEAKVRLTDTSMRLNMQRDLSEKALSKRAEVQKPPSEPAGRAPDGQSYPL